MKLQQDLQNRYVKYQTRRHFLRQCSTGLGAMALGSIFACHPDEKILSNLTESTKRGSHFPGRAKRVIYLHMAGSPSQLELFDYKPALNELHGKPCPTSLLEGRNFAFISGTPEMLGHQAEFSQHGDSGAWVSHYLPHFSTVVDDVCFLKAMHTDEFNHAPAQLFLYSGSPRLGRPSMGSWITYGLGSEAQDLPGFVVLVSGGLTPSAGKSVWGSGFLPSVYQGVQCRSEGDPVLFIKNPDGVSRDIRRKTIDAINQLNRREYEEAGDPEILTRIAQYEMAFKMQLSVPEVMDINREPNYIHALYGTEPGKASFANNCLLARRLAEQGVRFIQLFHWGWDSHGASKDEALNGGFIDRCREVDKAMTALLTDLKQRGMLDETLVIWGGEFGRTPMRENRLGVDPELIGRDHHTDAFTVWLAGGGIKGGMTHGETDEIGYAGVKDKVHIHDLQATILHTLGLDHEKLTYQFQGRDFRLTDVHGKVVHPIIA